MNCQRTARIEWALVRVNAGGKENGLNLLLPLNADVAGVKCLHKFLATGSESREPAIQ